MDRRPQFGILKWIFTILLGLVVVIPLSRACGRYAAGVTPAPENTQLIDVLRNEAQAYQKKLPLQVAEGNVLYSVEAREPATIIYRHRFDTQEVSISEDARSLVGRTACAGAGRRLLDSGVTIRYEYYNARGALLAARDMRVDDCR